MPSDVEQGRAEDLPGNDPELLSHLFSLVKRHRQLGEAARATFDVNGVRVTIEEPFLGAFLRENGASR